MLKTIPEGYQTITPMCVFKDARQAIAFYKEAFGAEERFVMPGPDGVGVMHAEIKIGTSLLMLGEESPQQSCKSAESLGASPISFYLYLEDVDEAYAIALTAGAVAAMPVADMFWGDRIGTVKDPFGYTWTLATHVKDPTPQEIEEGARAAMEATQPLIITRNFAAPRERVWKAWTDPQYLKRWWGPKGFTAPVCKIDLRVGGKYLNCMHSPEGQDYWSTGTYREIVAPARLVCTDSFADAAGNVVPAAHYNMSGDWPLALQISPCAMTASRPGRCVPCAQPAGMNPSINSPRSCSRKEPDRAQNRVDTLTHDQKKATRPIGKSRRALLPSSDWILNWLFMPRFRYEHSSGLFLRNSSQV